MKIQYASDLHLEFDQNTDWLTENPLEVTGDVLVLAGDITIFGDESLETHPFFEWCAQNYRETLLVPGNHEYYRGVEMRDTLTDFEKLLHPNVRYLNNRSIVIDDIEFFITTLWSKVKPENEAWIEQCMTDCRRNVLDGQPLRGANYTQLHELCFNWLDNALKH
ncbi:MAG: metallophosphoesterase, partial [Muribaculaceae bacterium]|nr:metallophosphoesterase [Muribaculaceae bacterium]